MEKLQAALLYGADAVYLAGQQYGLRAYADNFDQDDLAAAIDLAHRHGVRCYVTLNILARPSDLDGLGDHVRRLADIGTDAVIVSDPGIFSIVRREAPGLEIHISTQASVTNAEACRFWYEAGARRIVLARELSLDDIRAIRAEIPADLALECFVHGAMCMAWSGRCLLSNAATGREANRGACVQSCRWKYHLVEATRLDEAASAAKGGPGDPYTWEIETDAEGSYFFNSRDLCMIEHVPAMIAAGIDSFKVEGRMKGAYYAAVVSKMYRQAIDQTLAARTAGVPLEKVVVDPRLRQELELMVHRDYDTGFYFDDPRQDAKITPDRMLGAGATVVGVVLGQEGDKLYCEQRNKLVSGETVNILQPRGENIDVVVTGLRDAEDQPIEACPHPQQHFSMRLPEGVQVLEGAFIRRMGAKHGE